MTRLAISLAILVLAVALYWHEMWAAGIGASLAGLVVVAPELRERQQRRFYSQRSNRFPRAKQVIDGMKERTDREEYEETALRG